MSNPTAPTLASVTFDVPITMGDQTINSVQIRTPNSGELRGLSLVALGQMHVDELLKLLPRITIPALPAPILAQIDPADMMEIADKVTDFLLSNRRRADLPTT